MNGEAKKFQVVSNGEVLKGFSIIDVADSLANLYKISQASAIDTLICGKPRKVRSARSKAHAESICAKLQVLGLSCGVSEVRPDMPDDLSMHTHMVGSSSRDDDDDDDEIEPLSESTDEAMASIDAIYKDATNKVAKSRLIKRIGFFVILISVVGFGSWFGLTSWLKPKSTTAVVEIELAFEALKTPSAIAYIDLSQARKLSSLTSITGHAFDIQTTNLKGAVTLVQPLRALKSEAFLQQSDFLSTSVYTTDSSQVDWITVFTGEFKSKQVVEELRLIFNVSSFRDGVYQLSSKNAVSDIEQEFISQCAIKAVSSSKKNGNWFVSIVDNSVVFSSSAELNFRFQSKLIGLQIKASEPSEQLQQWQTYRNSSLISLKAYEPEVVKQMPWAEQFVQSVFNDNKLDGLSLKVDADLLSQGVNVTVDFLSRDTAVLGDAEQALLANFDKVKSRIPDGFSKVNAFLSALNVNRIDADQLRIASNFSGELVADISGISADLQNIINEGALSTQNFDEILSFKAAEPVWDYSQNGSLIEPSNKQKNNSFEPVYEREGVAIYLDLIGADSIESNASNLITLSAFRPLSNVIKAWSNSGVQQKIGVYDVLNRNGKSLLQTSECLNIDGVLNDDNSIQSSSTVRLLNNVGPDDAQILKGWYQLKAPTKAKRLSASMVAGQSVSWNNGAFRLSRVQGSTVQYRVYGQQQDLLTIRGVNAEGQDLHEHSVKKDGDVITATFNGLVDHVDLLIAEAWENEKFDFSLSDVKAKPTQKNITKHRSQDVIAFTRSEKAAFRKRLPNDKLLKRFPVSNSEYGRIQTKSSHIILTLETLNGTPDILVGDVVVPLNDLLLVTPDAVKIYIELNKRYKAEFNVAFTERAFTVDQRRYLKGRFSIKLDKLIDKLDTVDGTLKFSIPSRLAKRTAAIGRVQSSDLQLMSYDYSNGDGVSRYLARDEYDIALLTSQSGKRYLARKLTPKAFEFDSANEPKMIELFSIKKRNRFSEKFNLKGAN